MSSLKRIQLISNSYAENGDLMDWIISNGAVSQIQSKLWTKQIVLGMQYLHKNYIAHRFVKDKIKSFSSSPLSCCAEIKIKEIN